jgi:hypothetical protein
MQAASNSAKCGDHCPSDVDEIVRDDSQTNPTLDSIVTFVARSNDTHESTTDPDARLARKSRGHAAKLAYCGTVMIENHNGLVVNTELLQCNGTAERDAALLMAEVFTFTATAHNLVRMRNLTALAVSLYKSWESCVLTLRKKGVSGPVLPLRRAPREVLWPLMASEGNHGKGRLSSGAVFSSLLENKLHSFNVFKPNVRELN